MKEVSTLNKVWAQEKKLRHIDNLLHFTGFYHGTYYLDGHGQPKERVLYDRNVIGSSRKHI